jgi:DNA polymerase III sliding clamp (beta) subunit (PCNA family)
VGRDALVDAVEGMPDADHALVRFAAGGMTITVEDVSERVAGTYEGAGIELAVNPAFLLEAARAFHEPELALDASAPVKPLVLTSAAAGSLTYLVMPVRVR